MTEAKQTRNLDRRLIVVAVAIGVWLGGCAEQTLIKTEPSHASVWVDGRYVGHSPALVTLPRANWKPVFKYRIEAAGCLPEEGYIRQVLGPGRVIGGIFSLGVSLIFKRPYTVEGSYLFSLTQDPNLAAGRSHREERSRRDTAAKRLEDLDHLESKGLLSEEEYREFRAAVLKDLAGEASPSK